MATVTFHGGTYDDSVPTDASSTPPGLTTPTRDPAAIPTSDTARPVGTDPTVRTGASAYNPTQVTQWYQQYLGRTPNQDELNAHAGNPGGMQGVLDVISNSPEAKARTSTPTPAPSFADPSQSLLEQYAQGRFNQRLNPDPNSGTSLYETYARQLIDQLKGPAYSDADAQTLKANAYDSMEQERSQTKQRYIEELSRRGIQPSSGIALDGLLKIDNHYNGLRAQVDRGFATQAMEAQRQNQIQALQIAAQLAAEQEGRQSDALNFAMIPYNLNNDAFNRNLQAINAAGSPLQLLQGAVSAGNYGQNMQANKAQQAQSLMEYLAWSMGLSY